MAIKNKPRYHPKLLSAMLGNFSYSLELLDAIALKSNTSKEILENTSYTDSHGEWESKNTQASYVAPHFNEIVITILGLAGLLSVCDESANQYDDENLKEKIKNIAKMFDYKNIRDILTHWDDYASSNGKLQKSGIVPKHFPGISYRIHDSIFRVYHYEVNLVNFYNCIWPIYKSAYELLKEEEIKLFTDHS
jgi:hypothetical protein